MTSAHRLKRARLLVLALAVIALMLVCAAASAAGSVSFTIESDPAALSKPGKVSISIWAANTASSDMAEPVSVYDPAGQLVTAFGDGGQAVLKANSVVTAKTSWKVTEEELQNGRISYTLMYREIASDGSESMKTVTASAPIAYSGTKEALAIKRTVTPEVARQNGTVTITYELSNVGTDPITNIRIRENTSISKTAQSITSLAPGKKDTVSFNAVMGSRDLISGPTITYQLESGRKEVQLSDRVIPRAQPGLVLTNILSADRTSVETGESVVIKLTIQNKGNITYTDISAKDAVYGELFSGLTLSPGETLEETKKLKLKDTATLKLSVTLQDNTGTTSTVESNALKISVYDPNQVMHITVAAYPDATTVASFPADMRFTITVTNNSNTEAKNLSIYHGPTQVYTISSLAPTQSYTITRDFTLSQAGQYQFTARVKDTLNNIVSFDSPEVYISQAKVTRAPTKEPVVTIAPLVTVTAVPLNVLEPTMTQAQDIARIAMLVLGALLAVVLVLFLVASVMRIKRAGEHRKALDSLDVVTMRDYKDADEEILSFEDDGEAGEEPAEETESAYAPEASADQAENASFAGTDAYYANTPEVIGYDDQPEDFDTEAPNGGGYRLSRAEVGTAPAAETAKESPAEAEEKPSRRRRSRRGQADEEE